MKKLAYTLILLCFLIQIFLIVSFGDYKQLSDYGEYITLAQDCIARGNWYPDSANMHDSYIFAPGLINYFILQMKLFGTMSVNLWLNLMLNLGIIYFVYSIANKLFNKTTAYISVIAYSLLYSTWWIVIPAGTEVPFLFLSLLGLWTVVKQKSIGCIFLAGIAFGLANWIRPLVVIFLITALVMMYMNKAKKSRYVSLIVGFVMILSLIGAASYKSANRVILQSSTSGVNLAYTSNDKAYGGVASSLLSDTTNLCYIKNANSYTYAQKDSIWKARSIEWIKDHPVKFAGLYAIKIPGLFAEDTWPDRAVLPGAGFIDKFAHGQISLPEFIGRVLLLVSKSIVFYIICIVFLIGLWTKRKEILSSKGVILIPVILGIAITCIFSVSPRYHYPFLFAMVIWAAYAFDCYLRKKGVLK